MNSSVVMLGLPNSGKTNYLVALDVLLDCDTDDLTMCHAELSRERAYLHLLREEWLAGKELRHTSQLDNTAHTLVLRQRSSGDTFTLAIPDMAGEVIANSFIEREFKPSFEKLVNEANGFLLFIHARENMLVDRLEAVEFRDNQKPKSTGEETEWQMEKASKQTKIVDILQFLKILRKRDLLKIAVIISAWDTVDKCLDSAIERFANSPEKFFTQHCPLLDQYLKDRDNAIWYKIYGVSARGGSQKEIDNLLDLDDPSDRAFVVSEGCRSKDLSLPIQWLLGIA